MKAKLKPFLFILALGILPFQAMAADKLEVSAPYAFAVPAGARSAAAFMTLTYPAPQGEDIVPDRLMSVETPVAGKAEMHTNVIENDTMMMRAVDSFPLPPTGMMTLSPQGPHIMMMELRQPLAAGDTFPMTLVFEKAGRIDVEIPVRAPGDIPAAAVQPTSMIEDMSDSNDTMHEGHQ
jgi:copper(I)-binding protein